ncbi:MAG: ABC transporter ATP-binding protein, partial [Pseudobdellovibrio sp.]
MSSYRVEIKNLHVNYGNIKAVKGIDFTFAAKQITTLIGSNGAGKTSTLKSIAGILPSSGDIKKINSQTTLDLDKLTAAQRLKNKIALCPEGRGVFPNLSVSDNLMVGAYLNPTRKKINDLLDQQYEFFPKLHERKLQLAGTLSGGEQQMLAIARALMSEPEYL